MVNSSPLRKEELFLELKEGGISYIVRKIKDVILPP